MRVSIRNRTRGSVVAAGAAEATGFADRLLGLMGRPALPPGGGLVLYDTNWIHMFWMRFPLDCVYIDRRGVVVGLEPGLRPNTLGKPFWRAWATLELPAGAIAASATQVGDQLELEPQP
ncbi:MAG: DUF192 domain-containing protein [Chloroflexi bacterium]|nr:DUF192 domain-containing protein [Chloroflexota bacterium]